MRAFVLERTFLTSNRFLSALPSSLVLPLGSTAVGGSTSIVSAISQAVLYKEKKRERCRGDHRCRDGRRQPVGQFGDAREGTQVHLSRVTL